MARPAEKARAMMNKWVALREKGNAPAKRSQRRPHLASECEFLSDAERFRGQIVREISSLIEKIQNPALGDHEVREANDDINHKMREKWHWNQRVHQLGGIDYNALERKRQIEEGGDAAQQRQRGYKYFGRAKELPGVKELLEKEETKDTKKQSSRNVYQRITPDYYGWRDEEDGVLLELETLATKQNDQLHKRRRIGESGEQEDQGDDEVLPPDYLDVPGQAEIDLALLEQRKKSFLAKYNI